jgi:hypothetical protein
MVVGLVKIEKSGICVAKGEPHMTQSDYRGAGLKVLISIPGQQDNKTSCSVLNVPKNAFVDHMQL